MAGRLQTDPDGPSVYVIEILEKWYPLFKGTDELEVDRGLFYVGQTAHHVGSRFTKHRRAHNPLHNSARCFIKIGKERVAAGLPRTLVEGDDVVLRRDLMSGLRRDVPKAKIENYEREVAESLRAEGHLVIQA